MSFPRSEYIQVREVPLCPFANDTGEHVLWGFTHPAALSRSRPILCPDWVNIVSSKPKGLNQHGNGGFA